MRWGTMGRQVRPPCGKSEGGRDVGYSILWPRQGLRLTPNASSFYDALHLSGVECPNPLTGATAYSPVNFPTLRYTTATKAHREVTYDVPFQWIGEGPRQRQLSPSGNVTFTLIQPTDANVALGS